MVSENKKVRRRIPDLLSPLTDIHFEKVDKVISPGLTLMRWNSLNLEAYVSDVTTALRELDLLIDRAINIHENRVFSLCREVENIALFANLDPSRGVVKFYTSTSEMCAAAAVTIETKSRTAERAVHDLVQLLTGPDDILESVDDLDFDEPGAVAAMKRIDLRTRLLQEADSLRQCYEQVLIDSQHKLLRSALENIRKRLSVKLLTYNETTKDRLDQPFIDSDLVLTVPDIAMKPSLDEIQKWLNKTVLEIISIPKQVYRWGQLRDGAICPPLNHPSMLYRCSIRSRSRFFVHSEPDAATLKTFYHIISENKEIQKVVHALSTAMNSTRRVIGSSTAMFTKYSHLWLMDRDVKMKEFLETNPGVNEFRIEMNDYTQLTDVIAMEPDSLTAGAVNLNAESLKLALCTEARAWVVHYGRAMNYRYQLVMGEVFKSIDDWTKRLTRPLKDLDDIRFVMGTLREIRENEIKVEMSIDPIEVS